MKLYHNISLVMLLLISFNANAQNEIEGYWLTADGNSIIEIYKNDQNVYFGKVVWLKKPTNKKGEPQTDKMNRDKSLRNRPMMGLDIIENMQYASNQWTGTIYAAKKGRKMDASLSLKSSDQLQVNVTYMGFSRSQSWSKTELPK
ncbi:MAG: DUF2147 domain-containing protein [Bacteroidota bacterium]